MTPLDFINPGHTAQFNAPCGDWAEALAKPIIINSSGAEWEVLSYYLSERQIYMDIQKVSKKNGKSK